MVLHQTAEAQRPWGQAPPVQGRYTPSEFQGSELVVVWSPPQGSAEPTAGMGAAAPHGSLLGGGPLGVPPHGSEAGGPAGGPAGAGPEVPQGSAGAVVFQGSPMAGGAGAVKTSARSISDDCKERDSAW